MSTIGMPSLSGFGLSPAAISRLGSPLGSLGAGEGKHASFASIMARPMRAGTEDTKAVAARQAAEEFVSVVFVDPILKKVREMNAAAPPFAPSTGEKQFGALLDAQIAKEITKAARFPLVDRLARDLRREGRNGQGLRTDGSRSVQGSSRGVG